MALINNEPINAPSAYQLDRYNNIATVPAERPLGDLLNSMAVTGGLVDAERDVYVDPVNGNDDNDGLVATQIAGTNEGPVQSIQLAVLMFKLPLGRTWARGADRTIHVKYTAGMATITEQITVPPHNGEGVLIIDAEENVLFSGLIENGALSAVAGFECRSRLTFTTAPLTPAALARTAFVRSRSRGENVIDACAEDLPIVANANNSVDVVVGEPGIFTAFNYQNGTVVDIVAPQVPWGLSPEPAGSVLMLQRTLITNIGGSPLLVRGFICKADGISIFNSCFLKNTGKGVGIFGNNTALSRCFSDGAGGAQWGALTVGDVLVTALISKNGSLFNVASFADLAVVLNVDFDGAGATVAMSSVRAGVFVGVNTTCTINILDSDISGGFSADARGFNIGFFGRSGAQVYALTISGVGGAIALLFGTTQSGDQSGMCMATLIDGTRVSGSAGNTSVGCLVGIQSNLLLLAGVPTLTGTAGDLRVGAAAPRAWGAGDQSDATLFARFDS